MGVVGSGLDLGSYFFLGQAFLGERASPLALDSLPPTGAAAEDIDAVLLLAQATVFLGLGVAPFCRKEVPTEVLEDLPVAGWRKLDSVGHGGMIV